MNKHINEFVTNLNLVETSKAHYSGVYNQYQYGFSYTTIGISSLNITFFANFGSKKNEIVSWLECEKKLLKFTSYQIDDYYLSIDFNVMLTIGKTLVNVTQASRMLADKFAELEIPNKNYCPVCGQELDNTDKAIFNGYEFNVDLGCRNTIAQKNAQAEMEFNNAPNNYLKGALGASLFALIGVAVWIILGVATQRIFGYIAILVSFLAGFGYNKFGGKNNFMKIVIPSLITIVLLIVSLFVIYYVILSNTCKEIGYTGSVMELLGFMLETDEEFKGGIISDVFITVLFAGIGILGSYSYLKKGMHKKNNI